ncbi:MAG: hypothetical protein A3I61_01490 [Acidobacteria bacterium RIFCSPLOWO2_02_FULL_68_18]|nr:MAG: hypothetical protein A3I61_01490 [Acidobacteria bacterium RIFCSPLOWO2_02_FULL_68_18]OFW51586.1 MAG: hypothetical protein A3G77_18885 [Acidobacteria bacterium RIFCSPLOWO2_12_FULL_68_19]
MPLTVRLTPKTERALHALARRRRQTRSDIVREAIEYYTATADGDTQEERPYQMWADVIGLVRIGARNPDKTTGESFSTLVAGKARARRPR